MDVDSEYGYRLLDALEIESRPFGIDWYDAGNIGPEMYAKIQEALEQNLPVVVAVNGPLFSPLGRGSIVTIVGLDSKTVRYADPADGKIKEHSWQKFLDAPQHPDGNFGFLPRASQNGSYDDFAGSL